MEKQEVLITNTEAPCASEKKAVGVEEIFPQIPLIATEFLKQNGFKAQEKRRDSFVSCGVSVKCVRDHLIKTIPGLAEHGINETAV